MRGGVGGGGEVVWGMWCGGCDTPYHTFPETGRYNGVLLGKTRFVGKLMVKLSWLVKRRDTRHNSPRTPS